MTTKLAILALASLGLVACFNSDPVAPSNAISSSSNTGKLSSGNTTGSSTAQISTNSPAGSWQLSKDTAFMGTSGVGLLDLQLLTTKVATVNMSISGIPVSRVTGTWTSTKDSVFLTPSKCEALDINAILQSQNTGTLPNLNLQVVDCNSQSQLISSAAWKRTTDSLSLSHFDQSGKIVTLTLGKK